MGRQLVQALKFTAASRGPMLCIPVGIPPQALLRPVSTRQEFLNFNDVRNLTEWRNRFLNSFLTEFQATETRTADWLVNVVGPTDTKILFMVDDVCGRPFGYMGLAFIDWENSSGEADAIVRGAKAPPGAMTQALRTLLVWAREQLGLRNLGVRVRSDNSALEFYRKLGFREVRRVPLRKSVEKDRIFWVEDPSQRVGGLCLVHMELAKDQQEVQR